MPIKILPYQLKNQIEEIKRDYFIPSIKSLRGRVLEIGFGERNNFKYYNDECSVYGVDRNFDPQFKKNSGTANVKLQKADAENLPFKDKFFDAVVISFVLCSVKSEEKVVEEISRVLKDGGQLILLEHIKSNNPLIKCLQFVIGMVLQWFPKGCCLNRDPRIVLKRLEFIITEERFFNNSLEPYIFIVTNKYR